MTETEESLDGTEPTDTNILEGTEEELFDALKEIGFGSLKKEKSKKKAKILYTLINKYKYDLKTIVNGLENLGVKVSKGTAGSLSGTMKAFIDKPESLKEKPAKPAKQTPATSTEKKALTAAEKNISERISKEIHDTINNDADMGEWIRKTYGLIADSYGLPTPQLIATAMDYWLFEKDKIEALLEEILGDDMYMREVMDDLVNAASPTFITLEKMKLMNQMTELVTLLKAYGIDVPQNLLPAHMRALNEIENEGLYGM